jgi:oligopeptide transport system permease protein
VDGLGNLYYQSIRNRDYNTLMAITVVYAAVVALANAVVDIAYGMVDPRIRDGMLTPEVVPSG